MDMVQISEHNRNTLKLLSRTVQELSMARSMETVMRIVRTAARTLTGADGATFVLRDGDLCFYADEDAITPLWKGSRFPMDICISGWAMLNKMPAVIEDIYTDDRIPHDAYRPTFVKSLAMVPIRTMAPIGAIGNYWATPHNPTREEVDLLQSLADITAVTIENINMYLDLENRVKERTAELEATNRELESFSYSVSHDLRAPLRSIAGFSNILEDEDSHALSDSGRHALKTIQHSAGKMNILIDELLNFSRLSRQPLQKIHVDMQAMVQQLLQQEFSDHRANITVSELPAVQGDRALLQQVWINLISNAIKYSSKISVPRIEIGSYKKDEAVVFIIKDNGAGFDMQFADKLFGTFQRLHKATDFPGTGVGLALCQRILTRHGGRIWAEATVNEGAAFYFTLPV